MNHNTKPKIALIGFPLQSYAPYKFLSDVLKILEPISNKIVLIDGNTDRIDVTSEKVEVRDIGIGMHYLKDIKPTFYSAVLWIIKCLLAQVKISLELVKVKNDVDCVIFYTAYPYYLLPLIVSEFQKKKSVEIVNRCRSNSIFSKLFRLQDPILYNLIDGISPQTKALIEDLGLAKYRSKLLPDGARFIDTSIYTIRKELNERKNIVGFISRISKEKGIMEFVMAIPLLAKENKDIEFLIGGSGDLLDWVKDECNKIENKHKVKITIPGWIDHDLPDYLNELKLLVLPTYFDAFPTILQEAMACGTPVLATSVGGIPDILKNEKTGFILESNSSKCIAENVLRVLNYPNIDEVVTNARALVEKKFTYAIAVERYRQVLNGILGQSK